MSVGFLANGVDTTLASLHSCTTEAVFSEVHYPLASLERHTRCLCGSLASCHCCNNFAYRQPTFIIFGT